MKVTKITKITKDHDVCLTFVVFVIFPILVRAGIEIVADSDVRRDAR